MNDIIRVDGSYLFIKIYLQPGAKKSEMCGIFDNSLKIKVNARPVDNAANDELINFVSLWLNISRSSVKLVSGAKSRHKQILVCNYDDEVLRRIRCQINLYQV